MRLRAFSASGADDDFPNSAERCPIFNLHSTVAHLTGLVATPRRPSYKPSCRCIALHKLRTTCAHHARDFNNGLRGHRTAAQEGRRSIEYYRRVGCRGRSSRSSGAFVFWLDETSLVRVVQGSPNTFFLTSINSAPSDSMRVPDALSGISASAEFPTFQDPTALTELDPVEPISKMTLMEHRCALQPSMVPV
jgi:hypothetical protein